MIPSALLALPTRVLAPILLTLVALVAVGSNYALQLASFRDGVLFEEKNRLTELLGVEQTRLEIQSGLGNALQVRRLVAGLGLRSGVTHAFLIDRNDIVLAALSRTDIGKPLSEALRDESHQMRLSVLRSAENRGHSVHIASDENDDSLIGHVPVHPDRRLVVRTDLTRPLALRTGLHSTELWHEAGLIVVLAGLLGVLFHLLWFRRTRQITEALAEMGAGRLGTRVALGGGDELGKIAAAVDHMAAELEKRQLDLARLSTLISRSPVVAIEWQNQPGWPVAYVSDGISQWGYDKAELLSGTIHYADLLHPDDRTRIEEDVAERFAHGPDAYQQEYRLRTRDGHWIWLDDRTWLSRDDAGEVTMIHGILLDVTRPKEAEIALTQQMQRLETAEAHARLGSWAFDGETGASWWSSQMYVMFDFKVAKGVPSFEEYLTCIHPDDRMRVREAFQTMISGERPRSLVFRTDPERGPVKWFTPTMHAEPDDFGRLIRFSGTVLDITALKEAEVALRENETRLRTLVDTIPDLIWMKDTKGTYLACNPMFERFFGAPEANIVGRTDHDFVDHELADFFRENDYRAITAGKPTINEEWITFADDGHRALLETIKAPVPDASGKIIGVLGIARDITAARQTHDALAELNATLESRVAERTAQLEAANKELESFSYSVSHDLKAPLRGIDGYSQILLSDYHDRLDAEGQLFLSNIRKGVGQMHELIEDLLAYSRLERRTLETRPHVLPEILQSVVDSFAEEIANTGAEVRIENGLQTLSVDRLGLTVALRNLLGNALKFSRDAKPPRIIIKTTVESGKALIRVSDNGIGIDMKYHDRIFEIFQRLHRAEDYPGTGVGLALVRKATLRMGGQIWAESSPGKGATFHLELPQ